MAVSLFPNLSNVPSYPDLGGTFFLQSGYAFASPLAAGVSGSYSELHGTMPADFIVGNLPGPNVGASFVAATQALASPLGPWAVRYAPVIVLLLLVFALGAAVQQVLK